MLFVQVIILAILLAIFIQDLVSRSVYWILFPVLAIAFLSMRLLSGQLTAEIWPAVSINIAFLVFQLAIVSAWFSLKSGKWVNITNELLGWGDVLFLLTAAFYLSVLNFLLFYVTSLLAVMALWILKQTVSKKKSKQIPLAGFQAILLAMFLAADWWLFHLDVASDDWLLGYLTK